MEIRFCDRCHESIPDADFDAGRAVTLKGRTLHVACALSRAASSGGPRAWLGFLLILSTAAVASFLLVRELGRPMPKEGVAPAEVARLEGDLDATRKHLGALIAAVGTDARAEIKTVVEHLLIEQRNQLKEDLSRLTSLPDDFAEDRRSAAHRWGSFDGRLAGIEDRMKELDGWLRELKERAKSAVDAPGAAVVSPPPTPPTEPAVPGPGTSPSVEDPAASRERALEVDRWVDRLKDPNDGIAFSATLRLAELKDLRAVPPLVAVLLNHKDFYVRLGAATSLGDLKSADSVAALMDALDDKDDLVRIQSNQSLVSITRHDESFPANLQKPDRKKVILRWRAWWKDNEADVRARLGQPLTPR